MLACQHTKQTEGKIFLSVPLAKYQHVTFLHNEHGSMLVTKSVEAHCHYFLMHLTVNYPPTGSLICATVITGCSIRGSLFIRTFSFCTIYAFELYFPFLATMILACKYFMKIDLKKSGAWKQEFHCQQQSRFESATTPPFVICPLLVRAPLQFCEWLTF